MKDTMAISHAALLRQELSSRNAAYAHARELPHVCSYGAVPVIVYEPCSRSETHGNFLDASYRAILRNPKWSHRLEKMRV